MASLLKPMLSVGDKKSKQNKALCEESYLGATLWIKLNYTSISFSYRIDWSISRNFEELTNIRNAIELFNTEMQGCLEMV